MTGNPISLTLSGYGFTGTAYQIGNANTELIFAGQRATISVNLGGTLSGQVIRVFRSINQGITYTELTTCVVTLG
jgi:hypothetical protein